MSGMNRDDLAWYGGGVIPGGLVLAVDVYLFGWTAAAAVAGVALGLVTGIIYTIGSLASGWPSPEWWATRHDTKKD